MNINDYKNDINKIVPSESFISETEALMKAARDRQLIAPRGITVRKTVLRSLAAAAAVLICAAAVNLYVKNMNTGIVGGEKSAETGLDTVDHEDIISTVTAPAAGETDISESINNDISDITETAETEEIEEIAEIEEIETISEMEVSESISDQIPETENAPIMTGSSTEEVSRRETAPAETSSEEAPEDSGSPEDIMIAAEPPAVIQEETEEEVFYEYKDDSGYDAELCTDEELFDDSDAYDHHDAPDTGSVDAGAGAEKPQFAIGAGYGSDDMYDNGDGGAAVTDEEDRFEEEAAGQSSSGVYGGYGGYGGVGWWTTVSNTYSASYNMNSTDMDILSAKDEVYVPDSIDMLDKGTYYMKVSFGKGKADISSDDDSSLKGVIGCIDNISYNNSPVYSDKKTDMNDCRGKIEICSAQFDSGGTMMFEVMYNDEYMVINRYDNGTVSSERYTISESDVKKADSVLSSCVK